ncbi:MAG: hypothetical protein F4Z50_15305 [Gemmatimonadetes bacterium]|nr:hypothetical protein [Gemmatimonadota bacterium]
MNEKRRRPAVGHAIALVGVALGALVAACDAPFPTELGEAVDEVVANEGNEANEGTVASLANPPAPSPLAKWFDSDAAPLVFVDDVRIETPDDLPEAVRLWIEGGVDDDLAERLKVVRGARATDLYGEEGANGAILIFTGRDGGDSRLRWRWGSPPRTRPPLVVVDGQRWPPPAVPSNPLPYQFGYAVGTAFFLGIADLDIESFRIIKGAAAVLYYGDEAVGGVIDIVTKNPGSAR